MLDHACLDAERFHALFEGIGNVVPHLAREGLEGG